MSKKSNRGRTQPAHRLSSNLWSLPSTSFVRSLPNVNHVFPTAHWWNWHCQPTQSGETIVELFALKVQALFCRNTKSLPKRAHTLLSWWSVSFTEPSQTSRRFLCCLPGESGLGKTTLINTLFSTELSAAKDYSRRHVKQLDKLTEVRFAMAPLFSF